VPDVGHVPPGGPAPSVPEKGPGGEVPPPAGAQDGFKAQLDRKLAARRARRAISQERLGELIRLFNRRGEAFESARLVTKYPPIEKDDALYEIRTDRGARRVMRSRDGSYTIFE